MSRQAFWLFWHVEAAHLLICRSVGEIRKRGAGDFRHLGDAELQEQFAEQARFLAQHDPAFVKQLVWSIQRAE